MKEVYCLPGTMCDERLWQLAQPLLKEIQIKHVVLPMENSIDEVVEALAAQLPSESIPMLGFSMGGYLASCFAIRYPERVEKLMVVSNTGVGLLESELAQRKQALNWVAQQGYKGIPKRKAMAMLGERNKHSDFLINIIQEMDAALGEAVLIQQLTSTLERPALLSGLADLSMDLSFCLGEEDTLVSVESLNPLIQKANFSFHVAKHCGHMVPLEQPLWFAKQVAAFFNS